MNRTSRLLAATGIVVLAGVAGWFRPVPQAGGKAASQQGAWSLPTPEALQRSSVELFRQARGAAWVGAGGSGGGEAGVTWTLLGVSDQGDARAARVRVGSDPLIKRYQSGDTLPDGSKIVSVGNNGIVIEKDGCRMQRALYPTVGDPPPEGTDGCPAPGKHQEDQTQ